MRKNGDTNNTSYCRTRSNCDNLGIGNFRGCILHEKT